MSVDASFKVEPLSSVTSGKIPYSFSAFPFPRGHFQVHRVRGREALSKPYVFRVTVSSTALVGEDLERIAVGHRAVLVMRGHGPTRVVSGIVESVRSEGVEHAGRTSRFTFRIVPAISLLRRQRGSRIFQDARVDQVVDGVLRGAGISTRWDLTRKYPVRSYITQYEESDLAFVQRLLGEAGIFYSFTCAQGGVDELLDAAFSAVSEPLADLAALAESAASEFVYPEETVVFGDDASTYPAVATSGALGAAAEAASTLGVPTQAALGPVTVGLAAPSLYYLTFDGVAIQRADRVTEFVPERRVRSDVAEYREFDPARPQAPLVARAGDPRSGFGIVEGAAAAVTAVADARISVDVDSGLSASASLGLSASAEAVLGLVSNRKLETYEHHGNFLFPDWKDAGEAAARIRRATTRRRVVAEGESFWSALTPGHRFRLEDHPIGDFNREYVVIAVEHRGALGTTNAVYKNAFKCVPAAVTYVPRRPGRRTVQALETATVVGPSGEEIHVDASGRIKVMFHWDRRNLRSDAASCWIRSVQPWAGTGFGHQFFPRVGMEVAVTFEGGDPDKPVVIGSLYNGTHVPPFLLPGNKTQSGIRTRSSPGGAGHNELMFEDSAAKERIYLHAQRDLDEEVNRNHALAVRADETIGVDGNRQDTVGKNARYEVRGNREDIVRGDSSIHHIGSRIDVVEKSLDQRVSHMRTTRVEGRDDLEVRGVAEHRFLSDLTTRVTGNHTVIVGKHDAPRSLYLRVEGAATISTEDGLELASNKGITFRCGKTSIRIGEDGIELSGTMVRMAGDKGGLEAGKDGLKFSSNNVYAHFGDKLLVQTDKTSLAMGNEVKVDGEKILLNSADKATEAPPPERKPPTEIELRDTEGRPLARQRFIIDLEDGSQRAGVTDDDGKAKLDLPSGGKIRFPELSEVTSA